LRMDTGNPYVPGRSAVTVAIMFAPFQRMVSIPFSGTAGF
jgi:hypothetical protein